MESAGLLELPRSFCMTPVMRGFISYADLVEKRVDLADLWLINVSIRITDENQRRLMEVMKHGRNA